MKGIVSGVVAFVAIAVLWIMVVLPGTFNLVTGLFTDQGTIATIVGLVACLIVAGLGIQLAILLSVGIGIVASVFLDK